MAKTTSIAKEVRRAPAIRYQLRDRAAIGHVIRDTHKSRTKSLEFCFHESIENAS
ncbi:MAG: hypothetical protein ACI8RD_008712 [Bacillariaceae sp.]|jgi:hypothetical protein